MKTWILFIFLFPFVLALSAQSHRAVLPIRFEPQPARQQSPVYKIPLEKAEPFFSYFVKWEGDLDQLQIRFSVDGQNWLDWQQMPRDEHAPELPVSILGMTDASYRFFQLSSISRSNRAYRLECHFFSPDKSQAGVQPTTKGKSSSRSCPDLMPAYLSRPEWCPDGNCAENAEPVFAEVTHLVIHHSAGSNQSNDWPAVVRSIWDFHVNGRGWADIGYNWLVDPEGNIYQGRSNDAIGAHFCGTNTGTIGVCMLGDFTEVTPQPQAIAALEKVLSWKFCENGIDPLAEVYHASSDKIQPTIIGHRDGCATACPGDLFYPQIPDIRAALAESLATAVRETDMLQGLQIFPNPASSQINILLPKVTDQDMNCALYDLLGGRVLNPVTLGYNLTGSTQTLDLPENLPRGTYLLVFRNGVQLLGTRYLLVH